MEKETVRGCFHDQDQLDHAVQDLMHHSFAPDLIHVTVATPEGRHEDQQLIYKSGDFVGALVGIGVGAVLGAIVSLLVVNDVLEARWLSAFLDVGLGASLFRGIVVGAAVGGLWAGIVGFGWWKEKPPTDSEAKAYILTVDTVGRSEEAKNIIDRYSVF